MEEDRRPPSALMSEARRLSLSADGAVPRPPLASGSSHSPRLKGTVDFVEEAFNLAAAVKDIYLEQRKAAAAHVQKFYGDLTAAMAEAQKLASTTDDAKYKLPRDKVIARFLQLYLEWVSKPIGKVSEDIMNEKQWRMFSDLFEFREVDGSKLAFISVGKIIDRVLSTIITKPSLIDGFTTIDIMPTLIKKAYDIRRSVDVSQTSAILDNDWGKNIPPSLKFLKRVTVTSFRLGHYPTGEDGPLKYASFLHRSMDHVLKEDKPLSVYAGDAFKSDKIEHAYSATEWTQFTGTSRTDVEPWQQTGLSMLQSAQQAQSLSDRMYQLLTEMARSMFDVDKMYVTS